MNFSTDTYYTSTTTAETYILHSTGGAISVLFVQADRLLIIMDNNNIRPGKYEKTFKSALHFNYKADSDLSPYPESCKVSAQHTAGRILDGAKCLMIARKYDGNTVTIRLSADLATRRKIIRVFSACGKELPHVAKQIPFYAFTDTAYVIGLVVVCEMVAYVRNPRCTVRGEKWQSMESLDMDACVASQAKWLPVGFVGMPTALAFTEWSLSNGFLTNRVRLRFFIFRLQEVCGDNGGRIRDARNTVQMEMAHMHILRRLLGSTDDTVSLVQYQREEVADGRLRVGPDYFAIEDVPDIARALEDQAAEESCCEGYVVTVTQYRKQPSEPSRAPRCTQDSNGTWRLDNSFKVRKLIEVTALVRRYPRDGVPNGVFSLYCRTDQQGASGKQALHECSRMVLDPKKCSGEVMRTLRSLPYCPTTGKQKRGRGGCVRDVSPLECDFAARNVCVVLQCTWLSRPGATRRRAAGDDDASSCVLRPAGIKQIRGVLQDASWMGITNLDEAARTYPYMDSIYANVEILRKQTEKIGYKVGGTNRKGNKADTMPCPALFPGDRDSIRDIFDDWLGDDASAGTQDEAENGAVALDGVKRTLEADVSEESSDDAAGQQEEEEEIVWPAFGLTRTFSFHEARDSSDNPAFATLRPRVVDEDRGEEKQKGGGGTGLPPMSDPSRKNNICILHPGRTPGLDDPNDGRLDVLNMQHVREFERLYPRYTIVDDPALASILVVPMVPISDKVHAKVNELYNEGLKIVSLRWIYASVIGFDSSIKLRDPDDHIYPMCNKVVGEPSVSERSVYVFPKHLSSTDLRMWQVSVKAVGGKIAYSSSTAAVMLVPTDEAVASGEYRAHAREGLCIVGLGWLNACKGWGEFACPRRFLLER